MALKLNEAYPGRFNNPSPEYPQGSFKNRTTPTAEDGSYFEQQWANDHLAFLSSLLDGAGVEANGSVDQVGASQYYNALLQVINDQVAVPENLITSGIAGSFSNLKASATGLSALVTVTAGAICLKNASNEQIVLGPVAVTPSIAVSGVNGLDSGVSAASTWYSVWVIWNGTTAAGLLSLSATEPTLPAGYTHKARVGWVRSDSTANKYPLAFTQTGKCVSYKVGASGNVLGLPVLASGPMGIIGVSAITWAAIGVSNFVPPTASRITVLLNNFATGGLGVIYAAPNQNYAGPASANPPQGNGNGAVSLSRFDMILESTNIYAAAQSQTATHCVGWEDNL